MYGFYGMMIDYVVVIISVVFIWLIGIIIGFRVWIVESFPNRLPTGGYTISFVFTTLGFVL